VGKKAGGWRRAVDRFACMATGRGKARDGV